MNTVSIRVDIKKVGSSYHAQTRSKATYSIHSSPVKAVKVMVDHMEIELGVSVIVPTIDPSVLVIVPVNHLIHKGKPLYTQTYIGRLVAEEHAKIA